MLLERFLFVFAITIPFDIRDMEIDIKEGLKTIPVIMGKKKAMMIANILLVLFTMICLVALQKHDFNLAECCICIKRSKHILFYK